MGSFGGYYKGEKKKPKKDKSTKNASAGFSTFQMPEIISKKKPEQAQYSDCYEKKKTAIKEFKVCSYFCCGCIFSNNFFYCRKNRNIAEPEFI